MRSAGDPHRAGRGSARSRERPVSRPRSHDFEYPPLFDVDGLEWLTKPILLFVLSMVLVFLFFWLGSRKRALVPGKFQFAVESVYDFVRNGIAKDVIGPDFKRTCRSSPRCSARCW